MHLRVSSVILIGLFLFALGRAERLSAATPPGSEELEAELRGAGRREEVPTETAAKVKERQKQRAAESLAAQDAYDRLLTDYRCGKVTGVLHLELLHSWSMRIFRAEVLLDPAMPGGLNKARETWASHQKRMQGLKQDVDKLASQGRATASEEAAARFYAVEDLIQQIEWLSRRAGENELKVVLPSASEARPVTDPRTIIVDVDGEGRYRLNGTVLDKVKLEKKLAEASTPGLVGVIRARHETPYQFVVEAANICQKANIERIRFEAAPAEEQK